MKEKIIDVIALAPAVIASGLSIYVLAKSKPAPGKLPMHHDLNGMADSFGTFVAVCGGLILPSLLVIFISFIFIWIFPGYRCRPIPMCDSIITGLLLGLTIKVVPKFKVQTPAGLTLRDWRTIIIIGLGFFLLSIGMQYLFFNVFI